MPVFRSDHLKDGEDHGTLSVNKSLGNFQQGEAVDGYVCTSPTNSDGITEPHGYMVTDGYVAVTCYIL